MIKSLELNNFTVFNQLSIDFSPKINVIIGENGTGKTHLLKAAYGFCAMGAVFKNKPEISRSELSQTLTTKMLNLFMPLDERLGKLRRHGAGANEYAQMSAAFERGQMIFVDFNANSKALEITTNDDYEDYINEPIFIPTKEVLSFMKGFASLYEKYELSFDQTYRDICLLLDLPEMRHEGLEEKSKWAMAEIEKICGGRFNFAGAGKVTFKTKGAEYSANSVAEGFRKVGMLSRLLETGAIQPGVSGPLFWDEPEANMNPKLMKLLVQILLDLSRNGQQIILATHDYVLLKWLDLLAEKGQGDHVRFHTLFRDAKTNELKIESADAYQQLSANSISATFSDLYDSEIERSLGAKNK
jgi:AAA15 family ATPase/GTPase